MGQVWRGYDTVLDRDITRLTATGDVVGTKPYMSPEQIRNTTPSPRGDLAELRNVLIGYRDRGQERDPEILELRRTIARLQIATGRDHQAADALPVLDADTREVLGPADPLATEVAEMLERFGNHSKPS